VLEELMFGVGRHAESVLRLVLAAALGGAIGLEREASGKPAGFRTNLLICVGAALITEVSTSIARDVVLPGGFRADPGRVAAQIVSGVGFLGAGTILRSRGSVTGLTTAATLWVVAAIGIATGAANYVLAVTSTILVLLALVLLGRFEERLLPHRITERMLRVVFDPRPELLDEIEARIRGCDVSISSLEVEKSEDSFSASFDARGPARALDGVVSTLLDRPGIRKVTLH
jgi:putative Mg2+ transporter-C (MgtC) family protein